MLHYVSLTVMIYTVAVKIMKMSKEVMAVIIPVVLSCFTCLFYFVNNETLYWLCASAVYQIPCTLLFIYTTVYIIGIDAKHKALIYPACVVMGVLVGGSSVNVAVLACILLCHLIFGGCLVKKQIKYSTYMRNIVLSR